MASRARTYGWRKFGDATKTPEADRGGDGGGQGQRRREGEDRRVGQAAPHEVVVGPGVVEPHRLGCRPTGRRLAPPVLGHDDDAVPDAVRTAPGGGAVRRAHRTPRRLGVGQGQQGVEVGARAAHPQPPLRQRLGPALVTGRQAQPGLGVGLDDVGRGAPGVPWALEALHRAERRHPHLDAATGGAHPELLEGVAHGGARARLGRRPRGRRATRPGPLDRPRDRYGGGAAYRHRRRARLGIRGDVRVGDERLSSAAPAARRGARPAARSLPAWARPSSNARDHSSRSCSTGSRSRPSTSTTRSASTSSTCSTWPCASTPSHPTARCG